MKFLVCISNVPDTTTKIVFTDDKKALNTQGVQFIINPYDELALTKAIELKEAAGMGTVTVIHVGDATTEPNIRKALAIGADDAVRINAEPKDAYFVAKQIADYAANKGFDLILTGRESIDYNGGQVGNMVAEMLQLPSVNVVTKVEVKGNLLVCEHDIDGGREVVEVALPAVITAQKELTEPRIPNMRGIMGARSKPLQVIEPSATEALTNVVAFEAPQPKAACKYIDANNMDELVSLLHNEAKVI